MINFSHKRILVMGLGLNNGGLGVVQWLAKHGYPTLVTDLKTTKELASSLNQLKKYSSIKYRLGEHLESDFRDAEIVIQNPGARDDSHYLNIARKNGALIINEAIMFFDRCPAKIVAITGTRGKSSTSWFLHQLLNKARIKNILTGNIARQSMLQVLDSCTANDVVVVELSSWHLDKFYEFNYAPDIAILTNIYRDHLNSYESFAAYQKAKAGVTVNQYGKQHFITNKTNKLCLKIASHSPAKVKYFDKLPEKLAYRLKIRGLHNQANMAAAIEAALLLGVKKSQLARLLPQIKPLAERQQSLGKIGNLEIINDTTSTSPDATLAALQTFGERAINLIAGGMDKGLDYHELAQAIKLQKVNLFLLPGSASDKLAQELNKKKYKFTKSPTLKIAVTAALKTKLQGVVLFSPGAASFNMFINEFDRGRQFCKLIKDAQAQK